MGRPPKQYPPLSKEQLDLCPYGEANCRICQLRPEQIKEIHQRKFDEAYTYEQIRAFLKDNYSIGDDFAKLTNHFNHHVLGKHIVQQALTKSEMKNPEIMRAIEPLSQELKVSTSEDIEKAYQDLIKMASVYTKKTRTLQSIIGKAITKRIESGELQNELDGVRAMDLLEKQGKLNKEAREFIKEISALRAPKVMVAQLLTVFMDNVLREVSTLYTNLCIDMQHDISAELKDRGQEGLISKETFSNIFRKNAIDFKERLIVTRRQQMTDAAAALQDMEKIL